MIVALSPKVSAARPVRERATLTVAASVLLHAALGWAVLNLLVVHKLTEAEEPLAIEVAPPIAAPVRAAPAIAPDDPEQLQMPERSDLVAPTPETPDAPPAPPQPPANAGSVGAPGSSSVVAGPVSPPLSAPRPTYRAPTDYPRRAELAQREGVAVVEVLIAAGGSVSEVRVISETPGGYGFGDAAMKSVANWRFETAQPGVYRVTVRFTLD